MNSKVSLLFLNVQDLRHRIDELLPLIGDGGDSLPPTVPRLFAFVETARSHLPTVPSYQWSHLPGPANNGKGGCALLYHDSFAVQKLDTASTTFAPAPGSPSAYTHSTSILWHVIRPPGPRNLQFLLGIVYVPPQNNATSASMSDITSSISAVTSQPAYNSLPLLLVGDFNAQHPDWSGNPRTVPTSGANHLANYVHQQRLHILNNIFIPGHITRPQPMPHSSAQPPLPTLPAMAAGTTIDLAIASDPTIVLGMHTAHRYQFGSDHYPLTLTLDCPIMPSLPPPPSRSRTRWRQHEASDLWQAALPAELRKALAPLLPRFLTLRQPVPAGVCAQRRIDVLYQLFCNTLLAVCEEVVGTKLTSTRPGRHWWSIPGISTRRLQLLAARRASLDATTPTARERALHTYRRQQATWQTTVRLAKAQSRADLADQINQSNSKQRWAAMRRTEPSALSPLHSIPDANGTLPSDLNSSLDNLCAAFVSEATPPPAPVAISFQRHIDMQNWIHPTRSTLPPHASDQWSFSTAEVEQQCKYQHIQSAPGPDNILPAFLRYGGHLVHVILSLLFTYSWRHAVLPQAWTEANVMALYKGAAAAARGKPAGSRAQPSSYRPISMTSIIVRTFEHLIHKRLVADLEQRHFFHHLQFGFRAGHTTADAINFLLSTIRRTTQRDHYYTDEHGVVGRHKMPCPIIFLDIKKAFDRVWPEDLLHCLHNASITGKAWRWIRAFLSHRRIRTTHLDTCSQWHSIGYGVPQGCVLSPLLFLIFINPILTRISTECPNLCPVAFADDGALTPAIIERDPTRIAAEQRRSHLPAAAPIERPFHLTNYLHDLHHALYLLDVWCSESRVRFGAEKTQVVVFCGAQFIHDPTQFTNFRLCGFTICVATSYTYLGVVLHHKLSWACGPCAGCSPT
jgi:hypothetical protein